MNTTMTMMTTTTTTTTNKKTNEIKKKKNRQIQEDEIKFKQTLVHIKNYYDFFPLYFLIVSLVGEVFLFAKVAHSSLFIPQTATMRTENKIEYYYHFFWFAVVVAVVLAAIEMCSRY